MTAAPEQGSRERARYNAIGMRFLKRCEAALAVRFLGTLCHG